jgi:hypothetical protein
MAPRPNVKAILICDQIIHEYGTNKKSLIGIFEDIHIPAFPHSYPRIAVYVNLTDAHGKYVLELRLVNSADNSVIGSGKTPEVEIDNPLRTCEFALQIQNLVFRNHGVYEFQVFANGALVATKAFNVKRVRTGPPQPPPQPPGFEPGAQQG